MDVWICSKRPWGAQRSVTSSYRQPYLGTVFMASIVAVAFSTLARTGSRLSRAYITQSLPVIYAPEYGPQLPWRLREWSGMTQGSTEIMEYPIKLGYRTFYTSIIFSGTEAISHLAKQDKSCTGVVQIAETNQQFAGYSLQTVDFIGTPDRIRTCDLRIRSQLINTRLCRVEER